MLYAYYDIGYCVPCVTNIYTSIEIKYCYCSLTWDDYNKTHFQFNVLGHFCPEVHLILWTFRSLFLNAGYIDCAISETRVPSSLGKLGKTNIIPWNIVVPNGLLLLKGAGLNQWWMSITSSKQVFLFTFPQVLIKATTCRVLMAHWFAAPFVFVIDITRISFASTWHYISSTGY